MLLDALATARGVTEKVSESLQAKAETPPEPAVLDRLRECLRQAPDQCHRRRR